jgi:hypothetical protein
MFDLAEYDEDVAVGGVVRVVEVLLATTFCLSVKCSA